MKIKDIILEQPASGFQQGANLVKTIMSPGKAIAGAIKKDSGYKSGYDAVKKLMTPSQWFKKDSDDQEEEEGTGYKPFELRDTLVDVTKGKILMQNDISILEKYKESLKAGKVKTSQNQDQVISVLDMLIKRQPIDQNSKDLVTKLVSEI